MLSHGGRSRAGEMRSQGSRRIIKSGTWFKPCEIIEISNAPPGAAKQDVREAIAEAVAKIGRFGKLD